MSKLIMIHDWLGKNPLAFLFSIIHFTVISITSFFLPWYLRTKVRVYLLLHLVVFENGARITRNEEHEPTIHMVSYMIQDGGRNRTEGARFDTCGTNGDLTG